VNGSFKFEDKDLNDTHTISVANGGVPTLALPQGYSNDFSHEVQEIINNATFNLHDITDSNSNGSISKGDVSWTFQVDPTYFDFLAEGETITLSYEIRVKEDSSDLYTTETVNINVRGTNDAPVIVSSTASIINSSEDIASTKDTDDSDNVTDVGLTPVSGHSSDPVVVEGHFVFKDVDLTDTHEILGFTMQQINAGKATIAASDLPKGSINLHGGSISGTDLDNLLAHATFTLTSATDSTNNKTIHTGEVFLGV